MHRSECCLTRRSSRLATAGHSRPPFHSGPSAPSRRSRLNFDVVQQARPSMKIRSRFGDRRDLADQISLRVFESGGRRTRPASGRRDLACFASAACSPFLGSPPDARQTKRLAPRAYAPWVPLRYALGQFQGSASEVALHNLSFERTAFGVRSLSRWAS